MKIAIESNDGITIKSPFLKTRGYLVYDIDETHISSFEYRKALERRIEPKPNNTFVTENLHSVLDDCGTIISRGMDRVELQSFKQEGKEVFITFNTSAKDAVNLYIKELLMSPAIHH